MKKKFIEFEKKIIDETYRDNAELRIKIREGKAEIISAIKELNSNLNKINDNLTEYKLETTEKITRLETIRKI